MVRPHSHFAWNRALAYGVRFDEVMLPQAGVARYVPGGRYYGDPDHELYHPAILKLHGSLNWLVHTGIPLADGLPIDPSRSGRTLVARGHHSVSLPAMRDGEILRPLIVTPVLHKAALHNPLIDEVWQQARRELPLCERLVVIGYSFPPTDSHVRRLLREAFAEGSPRELVVANPDAQVLDVVRDLCGYRRGVLSCSDLETFLEGAI